MQCKQCGQRNHIHINGKLHCANCGQQTVDQNVLNLQPDQLSEQSTSTEQTAPSAPVLDLSQQQPPAAPKPAQQLHNQAPTSSAPAGEKPAPQPPAQEPAPQPVGQSQNRAARMQQVARSEHISKFPPVTDAAPAHNQPPETPDQPPAPAPTPPPAEKPDLNQEIAKRHSRTASAEPPETDQPLPEAAEEADTKPGFFKRLFTARPRLTSATAAVLSVLVLAGYVTYLNFPNIALRVAASKAGFTARMPNYLPNDYDFSGPVAYGPGRIVVNFTSDDGNTVALTQRQTNLDSQSLLENHVLEKTDKYLTFYEKGLTIYIYNGNNAAWVNRGVLYEISGNNLLNSEQVIRMATSL